MMLRHIRLPIRNTINFKPLSSLRISPVPKRSLSTSPSLSNKPLPPRLKLDDADITIAYLKGTGPGGQKIVPIFPTYLSTSPIFVAIVANAVPVPPQNKTNSAVQLIHKPTGVVVKSQATRSRSQNEKYARQILADKVEQVLSGDQSRVALKAERERKKKASRVKKTRRKYRELEEEKRAGEEGERGSKEGGALEEEDDDVGRRRGPG